MLVLYQELPSPSDAVVCCCRMVDDAVLRRFALQYEVGLPDQKQRAKILLGYLRKHEVRQGQLHQAVNAAFVLWLALSWDSTHSASTSQPMLLSYGGSLTCSLSIREQLRHHVDTPDVTHLP